MAPEFLAISPNNKIPRSSIRTVPMQSRRRVRIRRDPALSRREDRKFLPKPSRERIRVYEWLMWQMGGFGPMPGQVHHFIALRNEGTAPMD